MDNFNNTKIHLRQGNIYRTKGECDLALREFDLAITEEPHNELVWIELGKTYKMMDKCPEAIQKFIQAVRINPKNKEAIAELGETSRLSKNYEPAMKEFKEIINRDSCNEHAHIELAKIYQQMASYEKALEELNKAYALNPDNSAILLGLGQVYKSKGEKNKARVKFKEAVKLNAKNKDAHIELGKVYQEEKDYPLATEEIKSALDISPLDTKARLNLIQLYVQQNRYDLAEKESQRILEIVPGDSFSQDQMLNEIEILQRKTILNSKVKRLWVTVTSRCNIKCRTCGLWSNPWDLPRKTAEEVIELFPYLERVVWLGGEVFLYKYFAELFQKALAFAHLQQQIITNGVILNREWISRIIQANAELTFSVDGVTKDVYEYIRRGASFEKLIENIKITNQLRQRYHSKTKMRLNALIMKSNYHQIEEFIDFAKSYNFDQLSLLAVHFDEDPQENILYSKKDNQALEFITTAVPKVKQKAKAYNIDLDILLPTENLKFDDFKHNEINPSFNNEETLHCKMPWKYMFICDDGKVYLTGSCIKIIGNIYENSLAEIWNCQLAQLYRESMLKNQFQELCRSECMTRWEV